MRAQQDHVLEAMQRPDHGWLGRLLFFLERSVRAWRNFALRQNRIGTGLGAAFVRKEARSGRHGSLYGQERKGIRGDAAAERHGAQTLLFSDVCADPNVETVTAGVSALLSFMPDCVAAFGGAPP